MNVAISPASQQIRDLTKLKYGDNHNNYNIFNRHMRNKKKQINQMVNSFDEGDFRDDASGGSKRNLRFEKFGQFSNTERDATKMNDSEDAFLMSFQSYSGSVNSYLRYQKNKQIFSEMNNLNPH